MQKDRFPSRLSLLFTVLLIAVAASVYAGPQVTRVQLGTAVSDSCYAVVLDIDGSGNGVWVNPTDTEGNSTTNPNAPAGPGGIGLLAVPADMFGLADGYGQLLLSVTAASVGELGTELGNLGNNLPVNANTTIMGGATGPVNMNNIELSRAIPESTEVTFTVDMNGEPPHLVGVMGGSYPTVFYDPAGDSLTITTKTFSTTTNALDAFSSIVGFMIMTDTTLGTTPLRIIAQTNHWVGDIFPLLPGFDDSSAVTGNGGSQGSNTAKCGTSIYGPTGQSRDVNVFFADTSITAMFGSGISASDLLAYVDSTEDGGAVINTGVTNFGVTGTKASFTYTFASPKDASIGVVSAVGIDDDYRQSLPNEYFMSKCYPNPFNASVLISYNLPVSSNVSITIYNTIGQKVETIFEGNQQAGYNQAQWNAGEKQSGVYFYNIKSGDHSEYRKMVLLK